MNNLRRKKLNRTSSYRFLSLLSISAFGLFITPQTASAAIRFRLYFRNHTPTTTSPLTDTYLGATPTDTCVLSNKNKLGNQKKSSENKKCLKTTKVS